MTARFARDGNPLAGLRRLAEEITRYGCVLTAVPAPLGPAKMHTTVGSSARSARSDRRGPAVAKAPLGPTSTDTGPTEPNELPEDATTTPDPDHAEVWEMVAAAQGGDSDAFGQLYDRYVTTVYRFIYYRLGDRAQAEDLTSETFVRALRRLHSVSYQGRDLAAWFVTIARNLVLDHVKSARYRMEITTDELLDTGVSKDNPEAAVLTSLTNARLVDAIRDLSAEQRECIVLRFFQGFSVAETAEVMDKNEGAVKAMQHRAVRRLHGILDGELG
ncbi:MAG: sigma-70 family RNA polymerase sigma factor [Jatrophihabitans sp.]